MKRALAVLGVIGAAVVAGFWVTAAVIAGMLFFAPEIFIIILLFQEACS